MEKEQKDSCLVLMTSSGTQEPRDYRRGSFLYQEQGCIQCRLMVWQQSMQGSVRVGPLTGHPTPYPVPVSRLLPSRVSSSDPFFHMVSLIILSPFVMFLDFITALLLVYSFFILPVPSGSSYKFKPWPSCCWQRFYIFSNQSIHSKIRQTYLTSPIIFALRLNIRIDWPSTKVKCNLLFTWFYSSICP